MTTGAAQGAGPPRRRPLPLQVPGGLQQVGVLEARWRAVPVPGGELAVAVWGEPAESPDVVLAVHDLTGNALAWAGVAGLLDGAPPLVAPDLRGRGGSRGLPGPYGLGTHVDDLLRLLDALDLERPPVVGHGAGALVAALLAERAPSRVSRLVLVDPHHDPETDVGRHLGRVFRSRGEHREAWRSHARLGDTWNRLVEAMVAHDAVGEEPAVRASLAPDAARADAAELRALAGARGAGRGGRVGEVPALVVAPGDRDGGPGQAPSADVAVAGASHWTLLLGLRGADAVSRALLADHPT